MIHLRQSTASQEILIGPFVDSTDGNTEEAGLTIANTDIKIWKSGATTLANKNSGGATHIANGMYYAVLDATDTDTIGPGRIYVHVAGALACVVPIVVLDETVYDVLFGTAAPSTLAAGALMGLADDAITASKIAAGAIGSSEAPLLAHLDADVSSRAPEAAGNLAAVKAKTDNLPSSPAAVGSAMTLTAAYDAAKTAAAAADVATLLTRLSAVRAAALDYLDAAVSTRSTYAGADPAGVTTLLGRLTALRAGYLDYLDAAITSRLAASGYTAPANSDVAAIKAKTDSLPTDPADESALEAILSSLATASALSDLHGDLGTVNSNVLSRLAAAGYTAPDNTSIGSILSGLAALATASALATVDGIVDAIKLKTDLIPASPAAVGSAMTLEASYDAAKAAAPAGASMALTSAAVDAVLDEVVEGSTTFRQALRLLLSALVGKVSGAPAGPIAFRDLADTKDRITATVDEDGNCTAITRDAT